MALYYYNSNLSCFLDVVLDQVYFDSKTIKQLTKEERKTNEAMIKNFVDAMKKECVSDKDKNNLIDAFVERMKRKIPLYTCAACGIRDRESYEDYQEVHIDDALCFHMSKEEEAEWNEVKKYSITVMQEDGQSTKRVYPYRMKSVYESKKLGYFHLHPEFVDKDTEDIWLCPECSTFVGSKDVPEFSITNGVDYGDPERIGFVPLNGMERAILARVRQYYVVVKMTVMKVGKRKVTKGHFISFDHDAPQVAVDLFDPNEICKCIKLCFCWSRR